MKSSTWRACSAAATWRWWKGPAAAARTWRAGSCRSRRRRRQARSTGAGGCPRGGGAPPAPGSCWCWCCWFDCTGCRAPAWSGPCPPAWRRLCWAWCGSRQSPGRRVPAAAAASGSQSSSCLGPAWSRIKMRLGRGHLHKVIKIRKYFLRWTQKYFYSPPELVVWHHGVDAVLPGEGSAGRHVAAHREQRLRGGEGGELLHGCGCGVCSLQH